MKLKRTIGFLLCLVMLLSLLPMGVFATAAGDTYAADSTAWGTQGNNGWYYMYKLADGTYHEMNFYDSTDGVSWRQNAFASDLSTTVEMFFINQSACFYGENNTRPVYAYKAPASGRIVLTMLTHSTDPMKMQVYVGNKLQKIHGQDELTLCTTGIFDGAMTKTELVLDVSKDEMVYVEFYSTDMNAQRQAWIGGYSVEYLSVKETVDYTGSVFAPNMDNWGTQGNNGWYYMYKLTDGTFHEMNYYDSTDGVDWRKNAYASDLSTTVEMFFINQTSFFTGENGSLPVYAYKAPVGGQVKLYFETHGIADMYAQVYVGDTLQTINGSDRVTFVTTGPLPGGMTANELTLNVKADQMIYIVCGTSGTNRQGWLQNYKVTYLSTNDEVDYTGLTYAAASSNWGKQDNNGWFYMYDYRGTGVYGLLDYYDSTASVAWQQNAYSFDVNRYVEMLFVQETHFFTGEQGSKVVYAFKAPATGTLDVYFETHGNENMTAQAYVEDTPVKINGEDTLVFTAGALEGAFAPNTMTVDMVKGEMLYIVCSSAIRDGWFRNPSATYTHACASNVTETEAVAPTCTAAGNTSYFTCSCGKLYSDAACTAPITEAETVLPAIGHNSVDGACTVCGEATHTTVYFQNNWLWTDVCLYYWYADGSYDYAWAGQPMTLYGNDGTYDIYSALVPVDATGLIINGIKNDGSGARDQSPDITGWTEGTCYYMMWDNGNQVGSEPIDVMLPPVCEHSYTYTNNGDNHTVTCANCDYNVTEDHNYVDGTCVCGAVEEVVPPEPTQVEVKISHSVSFDSDLKMNYRIKLENIAAAVPGYVTDGAYLTVEKDVYPVSGDAYVQTYTLQPDLTTDTTRMLFTLAGIQSAEMGSELRAVLHFFDAEGKEYYTQVDAYSILAYAQLSFDSYSNTKLYTMLIDMLNYGAAAQVYFGRNTDSLVNAGMDAYQQYATTQLSSELTDTKTVLENDRAITAVSAMGFSVNFADRTELNVKLRIAEGYSKTDITAVKVLDESGNVVATITDFTELADGRLQVTFYGIKSVQMRDMFYFEAYVGEQLASETIGYSVEAYAKSNISSSDANLADMVTKCIYYGDAAVNYFGLNKSTWISTVPGDADAAGWTAPIA